MQLARVIRGDGVSFPAKNRIVNSSTLDIYDDEGYIIGFITNFDEQGNRPITRIRHLSSQDAGRVIEMSPGVEEISINVQGYSLYNINLAERGSLIHRFGSAMRTLKSLQSQGTPFNLVRKETHPATGETNKDIYFDCWMSQQSKARDIGRLVQMDRATIQVAQKE